MKEKITHITRGNEVSKTTSRLKNEAPFFATKVVLGLTALTSFIQGSGQEASLHGTEDQYYSIFIYSLIALGVTHAVQEVWKKDRSTPQKEDDSEEFGNKEVYQRLVLCDGDAEAEREFEERYVVEDLFNRKNIQYIEDEEVTIYPN